MDGSEVAGTGGRGLDCRPRVTALSCKQYEYQEGSLWKTMIGSGLGLKKIKVQSQAGLVLGASTPDSTLGSAAYELQALGKALELASLTLVTCERYGSASLTGWL